MVKMLMIRRVGLWLACPAPGYCRVPSIHTSIHPLLRVSIQVHTKIEHRVYNIQQTDDTTIAGRNVKWTDPPPAACVCGWGWIEPNELVESLAGRSSKWPVNILFGSSVKRKKSNIIYRWRTLVFLVAGWWWFYCISRWNSEGCGGWECEEGRIIGRVCIVE